MIKDLIFMNGYGAFVWLSFVITISVCIIFYYKTFKTLKKYEKEFAKEFHKLSIQKKRTILEQSKVANQVLSSYDKSF
tara:strand:- start:276 stop:509 length:234 start_codon:yes stop_codon:yes gene_type:complete